MKDCEETSYSARGLYSTECVKELEISYSARGLYCTICIALVTNFRHQLPWSLDSSLPYKYLSNQRKWELYLCLSHLRIHRGFTGVDLMRGLCRSSRLWSCNFVVTEEGRDTLLIISFLFSLTRHCPYRWQGKKYDKRQRCKRKSIQGSIWV